MTHRRGGFLLKGGMADLTKSPELYLSTPSFYSAGGVFHQHRTKVPVYITWNQPHTPTTEYYP